VATADLQAARALRWPALWLGLALGGFFDGILLHQILQWHHLLSKVEAVQDMRLQMLADGVFHALMYAVAVIALCMLWRRRDAASGAAASARLWGHALIGFGVWHVIDAVVSHWVTGIHRIRVDSPNPLAWDLVWFFIFGVVPAVWGWWVLRRARTGGGSHGRATAASLAIATLMAGPLAALPTGNANNSEQVMVLFAPGVSSADAFEALAQANARVLWVDRSGGLWAVTMREPRDAWRLYRHGALLVSNSAVAFGCFSWSRPASR
jgi:uncharacterized membrane protein